MGGDPGTQKHARTTPSHTISSTPAHPGQTPATTAGTGAGKATRQWPEKYLRRKEVIQPHLPVRLPCYDLVPITSLTLDGSPQKGWATGFGCYPLS